MKINVVKEHVLEAIKERINDDEEEAFMVIDIEDITEKVVAWRKLLPRVEPFYAVKCNDDPQIISKFVSLGVGFDCASKKEVKQVLDLGAKTEDVVFANPCKAKSHIVYAQHVGVNQYTFDNSDELFKIKQLHPGARLLLRLLPDDSSAICQLGVKFGADIDIVPSLLQTAKDLGLNVVGVSYHVGSGCQSISAFSDGVTLARKAYDIAQSMGFSMNILDIGGGFPGDAVASWPQRSSHSSANMFPAIAQQLRTALDRHFPASSGVRIIAEPGRYMVHSACTLAVNVIARRRTYTSVVQQEKPNVPDVVTSDEIFITDSEDCSSQAESESKVEAIKYYVNDGVYGSFNNLIFDHAIVHGCPLKTAVSDPAEVEAEVKLFESSVWGPTCDGLDCIQKRTKLPLLDVGDWMYFPGMGAYTISAASTFNGFSLAQRVYV
uniref:Orn/DAP/Arg decarboxylase 2 N-terminal domain-containing protein n=1 Tax=Mucochytrium quahogii TaxID=96639 RepID=A0A7S2S2J0_9STRA|mmetsp:Transcript_13945/g.22782  ORF Transcript_13945/g.22782 Transcript_13945/m.22782 type:complete len:436 (+) Transcript_13945:167-1474(+)|eukprot:CAMPEP_0203764666 /NCGR_PEP_ID=MMETSP0098-20131031/17969_1 /ASSEMBLY_ACC=CAM_ASM_000208 /TAXON_ID=96639 /ORGANISM=" , Strain NY0313808BC1" /LENGTH=435 /DNA_ID=CAMNT_0050660809 /DNA_START=154 /DNA_END=1461 /DNA_ORIENTATION=+